MNQQQMYENAEDSSDEDLDQIVQKMMRNGEKQKKVEKKYHILLQNNKLNFDKQCKACEMLFCQTIQDKIYENCDSSLRSLSDIQDLNLEKFDIQCLAHQLIKTQNFIRSKISLICYEIQINKTTLLKAFNKYEVNVPLSLNDKIKSNFTDYLNSNIYIKEKFNKNQYLRNILFESCESIHNFIQNLVINNQYFCKFNQIDEDKSLNDEQKLNEINKIKKQIQISKNLEQDNIKYDFPQIEWAILLYQYKSNKNREKLLQKSFNLYQNYQSIHNILQVIQQVMIDYQGNFALQQIQTHSIDQLFQYGKNINYLSSKLVILELVYHYYTQNYSQVIKICEEIISKESPYNQILSRFLYQTYTILNDSKMAIKYLQQLYLDNKSEQINLFRSMKLYTKNEEIINYTNIQIEVIQYLLFQIAYNKLNLSVYLFQSNFQHWDLFYL